MAMTGDVDLFAETTSHKWRIYVEPRKQDMSE